MIGKQYQLIDELGSGGMGTVYRAIDRLTGQQVALKQVSAPVADSGSLRLSEAGAKTNDRLKLAREFRLLASLRHPNIISVLDYGFDDMRRPFYTMELVEEPLNLLDAGGQLGLRAQVGLLLQMFQALAYLHRRGVIHRDIKPGNVIVDGEQVKLVDFGISEFSDHVTRSTSMSGTVPYMAPELLRGEPASLSSDLYSAGVMAYELFAGRHPHYAESLPAMMMKAVNDPPSLSTTEFDARLIPIIERLLAKSPRERFDTANDVITTLAGALEMELPGKSLEIRESFLSAAKLVGRDQEVQQLRGYLEEAIKGRGRVLLVGGESGVGKSRLLEELRSLSLVEGTLVVSGQAVQGGGEPYEVWRPAARWLALLGNADNRRASALKTIVPDLDELLGRPIPEPPNLDPRATRRLVLQVVGELLETLQQPVVAILEDVHWTGSESLVLLDHLESLARRLPLLIVASFRDDEAPELPAAVPGAEVMKLGRLGSESIAELSESILGRGGRQPQVLELLRRETEGNAFFLVEIMRALAEEAGRLDRVGEFDLPQNISTGGIRRVIQRRLDQVPRSYRPLLQLAAVAGRELDLQLLAEFAGEIDVEGWLHACSEVAVLEAEGQHWRFSHDRLRQALLLSLPASLKREHHRRVAEAIERLALDRVSALAHHWSQAADAADSQATECAVRYLAQAGREALASCANREAEAFVAEALELIGTLQSTADLLHLEIELHVDCGANYLMSRGYAAPEVGKSFARARALCQRADGEQLLLPILLGLWRFHIVRGDFHFASQLAEQFLDLAKSRGDQPFRVLAEYARGTCWLFQGESRPAWEHLSRSLEIYDALADGSERRVEAVFSQGQHPKVAALDYGAWALWTLGEDQEAIALVDQASALAERLAHPFSRAFALTLHAWVHQLRRDHQQVRLLARESVRFCTDHDFAFLHGVGTVLGGWALALEGHAEAGIGRISGVLDSFRAIGSECFRPYFLAQLAEAQGLAGRPQEGLAALEEARQAIEHGGDGFWEPEIHRLEGTLVLQLPKPERERAEAAFLRALHRARMRGQVALELRAALDLAALWRQQPDLAAKALRVLDRLVASHPRSRSPDQLRARQLLAAGR